MDKQASPFTIGPFAPVLTESTVTELAVIGEIPRELNGRYVRNGPNPLRPVGQDHHWFLGEGMLHGIRLRDGKADWYRNRAVRAGTVPATLGEADPGGPIGRAGLDAAPNTNVFRLGRQMFATVEGGINPVEFNDDLETVARSDFRGVLTGGFTAHTKSDVTTGEHHAMVYAFDAPGFVQYLRLSNDGRAINNVKVALADATLVHDTAITQNHALIFDLNLGYDLTKLQRGAFGLHFAADRPGRIGVLPITGSERDVRWFEVEPCFLFHAMNAHEANDCIFLDVCRYDAADASSMGLGGTAHLTRWRLDLSGNTARVAEDRLEDYGQEFPQINGGYTGSAYRYGYAIGTGPAAGGRVLKRDFDTGRSDAHLLAAGIPGEFSFVPRHDAKAEDDGWLMGFVTHADGETAEFVILNAADLGGEPAARVKIPRHVPLGFHGTFMHDLG